MNVTIDMAYKLFISDRETFCSGKTIQYYKKNLQFFTNYLNACGFMVDFSLNDLPAKVFSDYVRHLRQKYKFENHPFAKPKNQKIRNTTIRTYCRAVKAFLNYCNQEFSTSFCTSVKLPKDDAVEKVPLYQNEVDLIDSLFNQRTKTGLRNYCIVHLMLDAGLRSEEVETLRICDVMFDKNLLQIADSKGNKSRLVLMCPKLKKALYSYVTLYRPHSGDIKEYMMQPLLMQLKDNTCINYNVIKQLFSRIKNHTGIERLSPHLLRHTFATSYIMGGGNLENLRLLLGHYDYTVTRTYLHLANTYRMMGAEIYKLDPIFFKIGY